MIRSSKHILKYQTLKKNDILYRLFEDSQVYMELLIDEIISGKLKLEKFGDVKKMPETKFSSAWKQLLYKTVSEILRSQIKKASSKRYNHYKKIYAKCKKANVHQNFLDKRFSDLNLKPIIQTKFFTRPDLKNLSFNLDSRFFDITKDSKHFDEFIRFFTPYFQETKKRTIKINIPIVHHKHSRKFLNDSNWIRKNSIRLTKKDNGIFIELIFEKLEPEKRKIRKSIGIDQGYKKLLSCSNGKSYGKELFKIYQQLSNKVQGSKSFKKLLKYRTDETNRIINKFYSEHFDIDAIFIEDLKNLKKLSKLNRKVMNKVQRWTYRTSIDKLERLCEENGIHLIKVNPAYTSQTCSNCGTVDKESRNGEKFHCQHCGYELDADHNASINIHRLGEMILNAPKN